MILIMKDNNMSNIFSDDDRQYLQMMQDNIARMANNSANCKTWMVTIVAGLCAIGCSIKDMNGWIFLAIIPVVVFWYLDTFYLQMERKMRNRELDFILCRKNIETPDDNYLKALYNFSPLEKDELTDEEDNAGFVKTNCRYFSKSIAPLYFGIIFVIILISIILNVDSLIMLFKWK